MIFTKHSQYWLLAGILVIGFACQDKLPPTETVVTAQDLWVDTGMVARDTVLYSALRSTSNGLLLKDNRKFSGYAVTFYPNKKIKTISSVYEGMMHCMFRSYYESGALHEARQFKENLNTGKHCGYWPNGNKQFDYVYYRDKKIGYLNRWYENGKPYLFLHYKEDKEEGLQQGWRENGKLFINYVAKDGFRYGLQETMLCYKLNEGNIVR